MSAGLERIWTVTEHPTLPSTLSPMPERAIGKAMGLRLQALPPPPADLTHAMEELSAIFEERAVKRLAERHIALRETRLPPGYDAVQRVSDRFPDLPSAATFEQLVAWLKAHPDASTREILHHLATLCRDPVLQALLLKALQQANLQTEPTLLHRLTEAERLLFQEHGAEIRAGLNLADWVRQTADCPEALAPWRTLYTSEVLGFTTPQACFRSLCAQRGMAQLEQAIAFLVTGCGIDLQSLHPSQHPEALRRILLDLQSVEVLRTVLERLTALVARLHTHFGETSQLSGATLTENILVLTEKAHVSEAEMAAIGTACGWKRLSVQIDFSREWLAIIRSLSPRLFADEAHRGQLIDAAEAWLETLIITEEEHEQ